MIFHFVTSKPLLKVLKKKSGNRKKNVKKKKKIVLLVPIIRANVFAMLKPTMGA